MWKMSLAPSMVPLPIGYLFYRKCGKFEKYRWLPRWLACSLAICFIENVENVKNIEGSLGESLAHWVSVLWEMWKMWKISVAPSVAPLLIGCLFYGKCKKCEKYRWLPRWLYSQWAREPTREPPIFFTFFTFPIKQRTNEQGSHRHFSNFPHFL